jgi:hypothetical protein
VGGTVELSHSGVMAATPRIEICPGIYAESVLLWRDGHAEQIYRISGGVFDGFEMDTISELAQLVQLLGRPAGRATR